MSEIWPTELQTTRDNIKYLQAIEKILLLKGFFNLIQEIKDFYGAEAISFSWIPPEKSHELNLSHGYWLHLVNTKDNIPKLNVPWNNAYKNLNIDLLEDDRSLDESVELAFMAIDAKETYHLSFPDKFSQFIEKFPQLCPTYLKNELEESLESKKIIARIKI